MKGAHTIIARGILHWYIYTAQFYAVHYHFLGQFTLPALGILLWKIV